MPAAPFAPLALSGALDIYHADALRALLLEHLRTAGPEVTMDADAVSGCDLAGLQLLCAARRSAEAAGHRFRVHPLSPAVVRACADLGLPPAQLSSPASSS